MSGYFVKRITLATLKKLMDEVDNKDGNSKE